MFFGASLACGFTSLQSISKGLSVHKEVTKEIAENGEIQAQLLEAEMQYSQLKSLYEARPFYLSEGIKNIAEETRISSISDNSIPNPPQGMVDNIVDLVGDRTEIVKFLEFTSWALASGSKVWTSDPRLPTTKDDHYVIKMTDSSTTKFIKRILNIIYRHQSGIVKYLRDDLENKYDFKFASGEDRFTVSKSDPLKISSFNIAKIFGVHRLTAKKWISNLEDSGFDLGRNHNLNFRRIKYSLNTLFRSAKVVNSYIKIVIDSYLSDYYEESDLSFKYLSLLDEYLGDQPLGEHVVSSKLGWAHNYLQKIRAPSEQFEEYSKYFKLIISSYLIEDSGFIFKDNSRINDFKEEAFELIYQYMIEKEMVRDSVQGRSQFKAIAHTLYALTKARLTLPDSILANYKSNKNPRGFYTLTDLSRSLSGRGYRNLLMEQIKDRRDSVQLAYMVDVLQEKSHLDREACQDAVDVVKAYINDFAGKSRGGSRTRKSYIGDLAHPIFEKIILEFLTSKGVFSDFETLVKIGRNFRTDTSILRDDIYKKTIERFSGLNIKMSEQIKFINIDYTLTMNVAYLIDKCKKFYQDKDSFLLIVCYDDIGSKRLSDINHKIQTDKGIPYRENIRVVNTDQFKSFLGMDIKPLDRFNKAYNQVVQEARNAIYSNIALKKLINLWADTRPFFETLIDNSLLGWNYFNKLF
jgi:hypothetical protein